MVSPPEKREEEKRGEETGGGGRLSKLNLQNKYSLILVLRPRRGNKGDFS